MLINQHMTDEWLGTLHPVQGYKGRGRTSTDPHWSQIGGGSYSTPIHEALQDIRRQLPETQCFIGQYGYPTHERPLPWYPGYMDMAGMPTPVLAHGRHNNQGEPALQHIMNRGVWASL